MIRQPMFFLVLTTLMSPALAVAQTQVLSSTPPVVEYQYQMYFPRLWQTWPGPGLSIGGSLPSNSREGISSFYGAPFPVPLGAGIYMNPFAYSSRLPSVPGAPMNLGLSGSTSPLPPDPRRLDPNLTPMSQSVNAPSFAPANQPGPTPLSPTPEVRPSVSSAATPASIQRSLEMESFGDEKMKQQNWNQAYANYTNAALVAGDRSSLHIRLAFAAAGMKRYPEAVSELKRAIRLDPMTGKNGESLASVLGPESQTVRQSMINDVARWAQEDMRNQDRIFLMGAMLLFNQDLRANEVLIAARSIGGPADHINALLAPPVLPPPPPSEPEVNLDIQDNQNSVPPAPNQTPTLQKKPTALDVN